MSRLKDPVSGLTHLLGAILSVAALIALVHEGALHATPWHVISFAVFGTSLILLYMASAIYHLVPASDRVTQRLRRIDHSMIYILIAGTYTPFCLVPLRGAWGWGLLGGIWGVALLGIISKAFWLNMPRWLSAGSYLIMGWLVVIALSPLLRTVPPEAMAWVFAGGLLYSIGAVIYAVKWPNFARGFGFHEVFHLFVMAGSFSFFRAMYGYVLYL